MTMVLDIDRVSKTFRDLDAVTDVSFTVEPGEIVALIGHNGAGKTTLMKMVLGLLAPTSGRVRVLGENPVGKAGAAVRRSIGFLPENANFTGAMTARELLAFYARLKGRSPRANDDLLGRVGLARAAGRRVSTYSKGMRQRLGLAQALIGQPRLLMLDEPTTGLDPDLRAAFYDTIARLRDDGMAVLLSTHALAEIETRADRVAVLDRGRLIACGSIPDIVAHRGGDIRVRVRVRAGRADAVFDRVKGAAALESVETRRLVLRCAPADKLAVLGALCGADGAVEDLQVDERGLESVYRDLAGKECAA
jgi:Cu-processing system ATP-binding protein